MIVFAKLKAKIDGNGIIGGTERNGWDHGKRFREDWGQNYVYGMRLEKLIEAYE